MLSTARSFTYVPASVPVAAALAIALISPSFVARGATVTYNNPNCASFTSSTTGSPPVLTVTCVGSGGGGGGGGGAGTNCTLSANPSSPTANTPTVVTASCPGQPASYVWTGQGCSTIITASCTVTKPLAGSRTFNVTASTGAQGTITVTWQ